MKVDLWGQQVRRRRHDGPAAVVHVPAEVCPECDGQTRSRTVEQPALLRHGGHGATERTTTRSCPCGWSITSEISEVSPR